MPQRARTPAKQWAQQDLKSPPETQGATEKQADPPFPSPTPKAEASSVATAHPERPRRLDVPNAEPTEADIKSAIIKATLAERWGDVDELRRDLAVLRARTAPENVASLDTARAKRGR